MRRLVLTYGLLIATLFMFACKEEALILPEQIHHDEDVVSSRRPIKPDYLILTADYDEKIGVSFQKTDTVKISKIFLSYPVEDSIDSIVVTDFSTDVELTNLPVSQITEITAWSEGKNGVASNPYIYKVRPRPFPSGAVLEALSLVAGVGELTVLWRNETEVPVNVIVEFGDDRYESGMNKLGSSSLTIEKPRGLYDVSVYVLDSLSQQSPVQDTTVRVVSEVEIDRSNWTATASSSYPGEGPGTPEGVIDGDLNTKWHSSYWPEDLPFPHWLEFDMKASYRVNKIQLAPRNDGNTTGFLTFSLEGSLDGENWFVLHAQGTHDPTTAGLQTTELSNPGETRYLRLNMLTGGANSTHLSEFVAFTIE